VRIHDRVIVISSMHPLRQHTIPLLERGKVYYTVVVHNREQAKEAEKRVHTYGEVVVSNAKSLVGQRNFVLKSIVEHDEWFICADDNIQEFTAVNEPLIREERLPVDGPPPKGFKTWREAYRGEISPRDWLSLLRADVKKAEKIGAPLVGVATMENPFFRAKKYSNYRFVKTKIFAMKNATWLNFKHEMCHDSFISAQAIARYGKVLVNSFLHHKSKMYEQGGLGNRAERDAKGLLVQLDEIVSEFPGLVQVGRGENTALRFCLTNENSVERWRREKGYIE